MPTDGYVEATETEEKSKEATDPVLPLILSIAALIVGIIVAVIVCKRIAKKRRGDASHLPKEVKMTFS